MKYLHVEHNLYFPVEKGLCRGYVKIDLSEAGITINEEGKDRFQIVLTREELRLLSKLLKIYAND